METYEVLYIDPPQYTFHYTPNLYNELPKYFHKIWKTVEKNLFMHLLFAKMEIFFQITEKVNWAYAHSWWKTDPTILPLVEYVEYVKTQDILYQWAEFRSTN